MIGNHLDEEALRRLVHRRLPAEEVLQAGWHLLHCPLCRERLEALSPEDSRLLARLFPNTEPLPGAASASDYRTAFERARHGLAQRFQALEVERGQAAELAEELMRLPVSEGPARIAEDGRFHSRELGELLLDRCRDTWVGDPRRAETLARLAMAVFQRLATGGEDETTPAAVFDLGARAWAYLGNVQRILSELRASEGSFTRAKGLLGSGSGDPLARAEVLRLEAALLRAQRRFDEALKLLARVSAAYHKAGDPHMVGRTLLSRAIVHGYAARPERSVPLLRRALELLDPEREPRARWTALQQLAFFLNDQARVEEALEVLPAARQAAQEAGSPRDRLRMSWLEGRINLNRGHYEDAERQLLEVRDGFIAEGIGYEAALASLDLACVYLRQGRTEETRRLATESLPIFHSLDIHREALAALMVFQRAVEIDTVTVSMVEDVRRYLQHARHNPELTHERPS